MPAWDWGQLLGLGRCPDTHCQGRVAAAECSWAHLKAFLGIYPLPRKVPGVCMGLGRPGRHGLVGNREE